MEQRFNFTSEAWDYNRARLTKQVFKILPMYEKGEDWEKQRDTMMLEFKGYNDIFEDNPRFMVLVAKLAALSYAEDRFSFRKLIFEAMSEIKEIQV